MDVDTVDRTCVVNVVDWLEAVEAMAGARRGVVGGHYIVPVDTPVCCIESYCAANLLSVHRRRCRRGGGGGGGGGVIDRRRKPLLRIGFSLYYAC